MTTGPIRLASPSGLAVQVNANGSIRRIDHRDVVVNLFPGNELEGGPANLFLRRRVGARMAFAPLLGPGSPGALRLDESGLEVAGAWSGLRFRVALALAQSAPAWFWHVSLENAGDSEQTIDLVCAQDVALADYGMIRLNEYYVSQYVDHTPLAHPEHGVVLAARQNLSIGGRHPWLALGALGRAESFCSDALSLHGLATRAGGEPEALCAPRLPGVRRQHEHSLAALQQAPLRLAPGARAALGFFAWFEPDHAAPSSNADLACVARALALPEAAPPPARSAGAPRAPGATLFSERPPLAALPLAPDALAALCGEERRAVERDGERLLSFFGADAAHVVLPEKERASLRPHGQILRTGERLEPDEASLTSTVWMGGVFHSMLTQGHVSIGRLLSTTHSWLGLFRSHGQRIFVDAGAGWELLALPSAFEMTPSGARWWYRHARGLLEISSWAPLERHALWLSARVLDGAPCRFLVSHHLAVHGDDGSVDLPARFSRDARGVAIGLLPDTDLGRRFPDGGFRIDPTPDTPIERVGGDELLFADGRSRSQPFLVLESAPTRALALRITGQLTAPAPAEAAEDARERHAADAARAAGFWHAITGSLGLEAPPGSAQPEAPASASLRAPASALLEALAAALPWLAHDATIHHLAPRGLEQYSGGGWGTRDVCQGPVELLLATGRSQPVRELLRCVFRNQNPDGDWPQWFMFFERERSIRPGDSHGDIVFWPLLALAQYLLASDDFALLDAELPFFHPEGDARAERGTLLAHVERALALIARRVVPGTRLAAYGHGDWNDSLQPVDPAQAARLCSAWTVTLHHQTFATLAQALRRAGRGALADALEAALGPIRDDFQRHLVADGVVAGLAHFGAGGVEHWLHPRDRDGGVHYSLLPMVHAILADLFTPEQAERHVALIREQLLAADGARLFDRPFEYRGGIQRRFQRIETSTFFGREIGLMYTHAHLRYAEAMAHLGRAEDFFLALRQVNPVGLRDVVRSARLRQANCYTSSSDADFPDRAAASAGYDAVRSGDVAFEGGWRVYSSGAGIFVRLVRERLLGLRLRRSEIGIDPVLPRSLDGLCIRTDLYGAPVRVRYRVGTRGYGVQSLRWNGAALPFARESNPYREGGALVPADALRARRRDDDEWRRDDDEWRRDDDVQLRDGDELVVELG